MRITLTATLFAIAALGCSGGGGTAGGLGRATGTAGAGPGAAAANGQVRINGAPAAAPELARLEQTYGIKVAPNDYWYDARSGLGGVMGGPAQAYAPGFDFGSVPRDASSGTTGVLYNGRELPMSEARFVAALFDIAPEYIPQFAGEYVLDANGDLYRAADGAYLGNLVSLAQQKGLVGGGGGSGAGGGDNFWSSGGASGNSAGGRSYISLPGGDSVTSGCG